MKIKFFVTVRPLGNLSACVRRLSLRRTVVRLSQDLLLKRKSYPNCKQLLGIHSRIFRSVELRFFNDLLKSNKGVALLMVMGSVAFLSALLVDFIYSTKINKLRTYNEQEKIQAKMNAESGLALSMTRLELYQAALNLLEKNPDKKKMITPDVLNFAWSAPFVYPIPLDKNADVLQKNALAEFEKNVLLQGQLSVTIQNASNLININLLRIPKKSDDEEASDETSASPFDTNANPDEIGTVDKRLVELLKQKFEKERLEDDRNFDDKYPLHDPELIIELIKYFINDENSYDSSRKSEVEGIYTDKGITPKYGPFSSVSELYLVPGLNDAIVDLLKDEVTVHGLKTIDVNKINDTILKLIFPDIKEEQVTEFFKYRDDPEMPHPFNTFDDFSNYVVNQAMFLDKTAFDKRIELFKKSGVTFGATGLFFKVVSVGLFNRVSYTLTALVSIPVYDPPPPPKKKPIKPNGTCDPPYVPDENREFCILGKNPPPGQNPEESLDDEGQPPSNPNNPNNANEKKKTTYLKPRVMEIQIN